LSCNVKLGKHVHINTHCSVGHDTKIGDFFTSASSVMIAGNNSIAEDCYFGMNSSTKQGVTLSKNITVGLNSGVLNNLSKPGTYFGSPAKFLF
jgi:UDP-3-O-[3-hydroxymyristoyl] glucosamine N-acyltransferase